jgi:hypothetical protein
MIEPMARPSEAPRSPVSTPISRISLTRSPFASVTMRDSFACLSIARYALFVWRTEVSLAGVRAYNETLRRTLAETDQRIGAVVYFKPGASVAHSADVRRELSVGLSGIAHRVAATALVHDGSGFPAAVLRSSVTALQLECGVEAMRDGFFSDRAAAARWVVNRLDAPLAHTTLIERGLNVLAADDIDPLLTGAADSRHGG